jgi:ParB family transcriptional regulator, chromosome partitioning protein
MAKAKPAPTLDTDQALQLLPLARLTLSDLNPRQQVTAEEIDAMADSIAHLGLLQNLIGLQNPGDYIIQIVGGGKRLRALQKLAAEGFIPRTGSLDPISVLVTTDPGQAVAMAGAENNARKALNPADEIQSYVSLSSRGLTTSVIAATYGQTEAHVRRMLKLAELPAVIMANLAAGKISIDQARALTIARSDADAIELLQQVLERGLNPSQIRNALTPDTVSVKDRRLAYVGLDAYLEAGGGHITDLFSDNAYLTDGDKLQKLFVDKGERETEELRQTGGWKWAAFTPESYVDWQTTSKLQRLYRQPVELPPGDAERLAELSEKGEQAELTPAELEEYDSLDARADGDYSDDDRATGGILTVVQNGKLVINGAYRRPEDAPRQTGADGVTSTTLSAAEPKGHPQSLRDDLARIKLAAMQRALLDCPELLLDMLAFQLSGESYSWNAPLDAQIKPQPLIPEKPEGTELDERLTPERGGPMIVFTPEEFTAFRNRGQLHRDKVLTEALARSFKHSKGEFADHIASLVAPDVRALWSPTAAGFLGRVNGDYLDTLWTTLVPDADAKAFTALKKAAKAKELESLFADMSVREAIGTSRDQNAAIDGWLPPELQWGAA